MDIPRDNVCFLEWAKALASDELDEVEIELSRRIAHMELQLGDRTFHPADREEWERRSKTALKFDSWRLDTVHKLQKRHLTTDKTASSFNSKFVEAAKRLLDSDTYDVLAGVASRTGGNHNGR